MGRRPADRIAGVGAEPDEDLRAPRAIVLAVIVAPNISTYQLADASGSLLIM
jgi:hypothetical protein